VPQPWEADAVVRAAPKKAPTPWATDTVVTPSAASVVNADVPGARITSTGRSARHNAAVGGVANSYHTSNMAADFVPPAGMTRAQAVAAIRAKDPKPRELLDEGDHVHYVPGAPSAAAKPWTKDKKAAAPALPNFGQHPVAAKPATSNRDDPAQDRNPDAPLTLGRIKRRITDLPAQDIGAAWKGAKEEGRLADAAANAAARAHKPLEYAKQRLKGGIKRGATPEQARGVADAMTADAMTGDAVPHLPAAGRGRVARAAEAPGKPAAAPWKADPVAKPTEGPTLAAKATRPPDVLMGPKPRRARPTGPVEPVAPAKPPSTLAVASAAGRDAVSAVKKVFAPTTLTAEAAKTGRVVRRATGESDLETNKAAHNLLEANRTTANLPVDEQRGLVNYFENRSKISSKLADPKLQKAADDLGRVYEKARDRIEKILPDDKIPNFIEDYYVHMWKDDPAKVNDSLGQFYSKQGSGRNFKARSIPTLAEGIEAGLTPKIENPVDATMAYVNNMNRFLASHDILQELDGLGYAQKHTPGQQPPGYAKLDGILVDKAARTIIDKSEGGEVVGGQAPKAYFAPEAVARVYNRYISKGMEAGSAKPFYQTARALSNGMTMAKLGLSAFHLNVMAREGIVGEVAKGFGALSRGDVVGGMKSLAKAPAAFVLNPLRGMKMSRQLLDVETPDALSAKVNDAFVRAGGRLRMDPFYRTRPSGSFFNAMERGTFKKELLETGQRLWRGPLWEKAKTTIDLAANVVQTVSAPLFEKYIPMLKRGAFASRMEEWLQGHPEATQEEVDLYSNKLLDSIDNRFGELVQDNMFWHKAMKQTAQLILLSPGWDIGTVREIGGGLADIPKSGKGLVTGKGITDRTAYVAALAAVTALENGIMTRLKTGDDPKDRDFLAYRTGGTDVTSGEPERAMTPGYQKDVYAFGNDFPNNILPEMINKLNPALSATVQLTNNKDYRGLPIYRPKGVAPVEGEPTLMDYLLEQFMPISVGQLAKGRKRGSNIGPLESLLSIRPAPQYLTAPDEVNAAKHKRDTQAWRRRIKSDQRVEARLERSQ